MSGPSEEEKDDLLLSCRYGELQEIQNFVEKYGRDSLTSVRDVNANSILHMVAGNGHEDVLDYLLTVVPASLIGEVNSAGSSALHWSALNGHLAVSQKLVQFPGGPGVNLIDVKNSAGRSPLGEAEMAGWEEGAKWFVEVMNLEDGGNEDEGPAESIEDIEVEIEDADGEIAKMSISKGERSQV